jgi:hypothetical protein
MTRGENVERNLKPKNFNFDGTEQAAHAHADGILFVPTSARDEADYEGGEDAMPGDAPAPARTGAGGMP